MNVLVTGSSGLIGTALVEHLVANGHTVTRLVRRIGGPDGRSAATQVAWDPAGRTLDAEGLRRAGPFDGVVNLAGAGIGDRRWSRGPQAARPRQPHLGHLAAGRLAARAALATGRPGQCVGRRLLRRPGRRGADRELGVRAPDSWPRVCRAVGGRGPTRGRRRHPHRPAPDRDRAQPARRGPGQAAPAVPAGPGRPGRLRSQYRSWITLDDEVGVIMHCLGDDRAGRAGQRHRARRRPPTASWPGPSGPRSTDRRPWPCRPERSASSSGRRWPTSSSSAASGSSRPCCPRGDFAFAHPDLDEAVRCGALAGRLTSPAPDGPGPGRRPARDGGVVRARVTLATTRRGRVRDNEGKPHHDRRRRGRPGRPGRLRPTRPGHPRAVRARGPRLPRRARRQAAPGDLRVGPGLRQRRPVPRTDARAGGRRPGRRPGLGPDRVRRRLRVDHRADRYGGRGLRREYQRIYAAVAADYRTPSHVRLRDRPRHGRPHHPRPRHRRGEGGLPAADAPRRHRRLPAVQRAVLRVGPRLAPDPGGPGR